MVTKYANHNIASYHDMQNRSLAIVADKATEAAIMETMPQGQKISFVYVPNIKEGLKLLMEDKVDGV